MRISIPVNTLKAAIACAATKDTRYCLVGVHVRLTDEQMIIVESTDGCVAFQDRLNELHDATDCKGPVNWIIPLDAAKTAVKTKAYTLELVDLPDGRYSLGDVIFTPIDGKFPDTDRVIPRRQSVTTCHPDSMQFNPELLGKCLDAMRHATGLKKAFFNVQPPQEGQSVGAGLMHMRDIDYPRCAIMPMRAHTFA